jgi:APA family basic amino acid/polyamine antiporter
MSPDASPTGLGRDAGLVRRVGPFALTSAFLGILLGSGIFTIPAAMAAAVGSLAPLAYLACALAVGAVMLCFAEAASRVPTSGGVSGFVNAAFGPYWGFITGVLNWASAVLAAGAVGAAAADAIGTAMPAMAAGPVRAVAIITWFFGLAALNIVGVGIAARFVAIATSIKLIPIAIFIAIGLWFIAPANLSLPIAAGSADLGRAAILGIFLFTGMESTLSVSGEVRDPARTIPRAILSALAGYAVMCIVVQLVAQGLLGNALGGSVAPLADAMGLISPALRLVLVAGTALSMLGWTASEALSSPRMLFALSRDGFLPAVVGRVHPRNHTPYVASLCHAAIAAGLAVSGSFTALVVLSTLLVILVYLLGSVAAFKLRIANIAVAGPPVRIPALPLVVAIGCGAMIWVGLQSTRDEAIGIAIFLGAATVLYRLRR